MPVQPWEMTQEEYILKYAVAREKAHVMYGKPAGKTLDLPLVLETARELHEKMVEDALQKGFPVPAEILKDYPDLTPKEEITMPQETAWERIHRRTEDMRQYYAPLFGHRVTVGRRTYELVDVNDLGVPYWVKVVRGKKQKTQYTLALHGKARLDEEMAKLKKGKQLPRPLPPDAVNAQELPFNSDLFTCYGKQTKRGFRAYCRKYDYF